MPFIEESIDEVSNTKFITTIDRTNGYWQIPLDHEARQKSAFITSHGLYEYLVMPFGMQNNSATFERMMDQVLQGYAEFAKACIYNTIIFSNTWEEHLADVRLVLR